MDNDFVRALTETMIVDNEKMWERISYSNLAVILFQYSTMVVPI